MRPTSVSSSILLLTVLLACGLSSTSASIWDCLACRARAGMCNASGDKCISCFNGNSPYSNCACPVDFFPSGASCSKYCNAQNTCSGKGYCDPNGNCVCNAGHQGNNCMDCQTNYKRDASGHCVYCKADTTCFGKGTCADWENIMCRCQNFGLDPATNCGSCKAGFYGSTCSSTCRCEQYGGTCRTDGGCNCPAGLTGNSCEKCATNHYDHPTCTYCTEETCSHHGSCSDKGRCQCRTGYVGSKCDECAPGFFNYPQCTPCDPAVQCSGHGSCVSPTTSACNCHPGFSGAKCNSCLYAIDSYPACTTCGLSSSACSRSYGSCSGTTCTCLSDKHAPATGCTSCLPDHYNFPQCTHCTAALCNSQGTCNNLGSCVCTNTKVTGTTCNTCVANYYGYPACATYCSAAVTCNGHGSCNANGQCVCYQGWTGPNCDTCAPDFYGSSCEYCHAPFMCSGNGVCSPNGGGACLCHVRFGGYACSQCAPNYYDFPSCKYCLASDTCRGRGSCNANGECVCQGAYTGPSCGNCLAGYYGSSCLSCPTNGGRVCNGTGACDHGIYGSGVCQCNAGVVGSSCQYSNAVTCNSRGTVSVTGVCSCGAQFAGTDCSQCSSNHYGPNCVFCTTTHCSSQGSCDRDTGACMCGAGYVGAQCENCAANYYRDSQYRCKYCLASATCSGRGSCGAQGDCVCHTGFTGAACDSCAPGYYGPSCLPCQPSPTNICNGHGRCVDGKGGNGSCVCTAPYHGVLCVNPVVHSIVPSSLENSNLKSVIITGLYFGVTGGPANVIASGIDRLPCQSVQWSPEQIVCTTRAVVVTAQNTFWRVVNAQGLESLNTAVVYQGPVMSALTSSGPYPTDGGTTMLAAVSSFGAAPEVLVGAMVVSPSSLGVDQLSFILPPGSGTQVVVCVRSGSSITQPCRTVNYDPPVLLTIAPLSGPTAGFVTTASGRNFGSSTPAAAFPNPVQVWARDKLSTTSQWTHSQISAILPGGAGRCNPLRVVLSGQTTSTMYYDYAAPEIIQVTGCKTSSDLPQGTVDCEPGKKTPPTLTIFGTNFHASNLTGLSVRVGGALCAPLSSVSDDVVKCPLPDGLGRRVAVSVSRAPYHPVGLGGVACTAQTHVAALLSYKTPYLDGSTIRFEGMPVQYYQLSDGSSVSYLPEAALDGGQRVVLTGQYLSLEGHTTHIFYGSADAPRRYNCTNVQFDDSGSSATCTTSRGIGDFLYFTVIVGDPDTSTSISPPSRDFLAYARPVIQINTLRNSRSELGNSSLQSSTTTGDSIAFEVLNLSPSGAFDYRLVTVEYSNDNFDSFYPCFVGYTSAPPVIICQTSPGQGTNYVFRVSVGHDVSSTIRSLPGSDTYSYATPPTVHSVSGGGCQPEGSKLIDCPTAGNGNLLTIIGIDFGALSQVRVGASECPIVSQWSVDSADHVTCRLPPGTGSEVSIVLTRGLVVSPQFKKLSYAQPSITSIIGCDSTSATLHISRCNRLGNNIITIIGSEFGISSSSVFIGGLPCLSPSHLPSSPSSRLTCVLSGGYGEGLPLVLFQQSGGQTFEEILVSYEACPVASFYNDSTAACEPCAVGHYTPTMGLTGCFQCMMGRYSDAPGRSFCSDCNIGRYSDQTGASHCGICSPGTSSGSASPSCRECAPGTYSSASGQGECGLCPVGRFQQMSGQSFCEMCLPGTFMPVNGSADVCMNCNAGSMTAVSGASSCDDCASGHYSDASATTCSPCQPGSYAQNMRQPKECEPCAAGRFAPDLAMTACNLCEAGTYQARIGEDICLECAIGYTSSLGSTVCSSCRGGTFANDTGLQACFNCPAGHYSNEGADQCTQCAEGFYQASAGQSFCLYCYMGGFQNETGATSCHLCSPGRYSNGLDAWSSCSHCAAGAFIDKSGQSTCSLCPVRVHQPHAGQTACLKCAPGLSAPLAGSEACVGCTAGRYSPGSDGECLACPAGRATNESQKSFCYDCESGKFQSQRGQSVCVNCAAGYYNSESGQTACLSCASGRFSSATHGVTACVDCSPGFYSSTQLGAPVSCLPCAFGSMASSYGSSACTRCALGRFANDTQMIACSQCAVGFYQANLGQSHCVQCERGKYASTEGRGVCSDCDIGSHQGSAGQSSCANCPPGRVSSSYSSFECAACPRGHTSAERAGSCTPCQPGRYSNATGSPLCVLCAPGRFQGLSTQTQCAPTDAGFFTSSSGAVQQLACASGTFSNVSAASSCLICPPGFYAPSVGRTTCSPSLAGFYAPNNGTVELLRCPSGAYQPDQGKTECLLCSPGTSQSSQAETSCNNCSLGSYSSQPGAVQCVACDSGTFAPVSGSSTCLSCPIGRATASVQSAECALCSPGYYTGNNRTVSCQACAPGRFQNESGSTACEPCLKGQAGQDSGMTQCFDCFPGTYSNLDSAATCSACASGRFQNVSGMTTCMACSVGRAQRFPGSSSCDFCELGSYSNQDQLSACLDCGPGTFCEGYGREEPVPCPQGSSQPSSRSSSCVECKIGTFGRTEGLLECEECAAGSYTNATNMTECLLCSDGYHAMFNGMSACQECTPGKHSATGAQSCDDCAPFTVSSDYGAVRCMPCPPQSMQDVSKSQCICIAGYYGVPSSDETAAGNSWNMTCVPCPTGADCSQPGNFYSNLNTSAGYWKSDNSYTEFYRCRVVDYCVGGSGSRCLGDRTGPICMTCKKGFKDSPDGTCTECSGGGASAGQFAGWTILIVLLLAAAFFIVTKNDSDLLRESEKELADEYARATNIDLDSRPLDAVGVHRRTATSMSSPFGASSEVIVRLNKRAKGYAHHIKILIGFFQIASTAAVLLNAPLPRAYRSFIAVFDFINIDLVAFTGSSCVWDVDFYDTYLFTLIGPLVLLALFTIIIIGGAYLRTHLKPTTELAHLQLMHVTKAQFLKVVLFAVFLIYPRVASTTLRLFNCQKIYGVHYLVSDFNIHCFDSVWYRYMALDVFMILVYPLGIPFFIYYLLKKGKDTNTFNKPHVQYFLGFLYEPYRLSAWFFELIDMGHKLFLTSVLALFPVRSQMPLGMAVSTIYFLVIILLDPYSDSKDESFHLMAQINLFLLFFAGWFFLQNGDWDTQEASDVLISVFLIFITILFLLAFLVSGTLRMKQMLMKMKRVMTPLFLRVYHKLTGRAMTMDTQQETPIQKPADPSILQAIGELELASLGTASSTGAFPASNISALLSAAPHDQILASVSDNGHEPHASVFYMDSKSEADDVLTPDLSAAPSPSHSDELGPFARIDDTIIE